MGAASAPKGFPPRVEASGSGGWGSLVSALLHAMAAFSWLSLSTGFTLIFPLFVSEGSPWDSCWYQQEAWKKGKSERKPKYTQQRIGTWGTLLLERKIKLWIGEEVECGTGCGIGWVREGRRDLLYIGIRGDLMYYFMWFCTKHLVKPNIFHNHLLLMKSY